MRIANRYVEKIRAGAGREGWPGGYASSWSIDAWKRGMLRKNPKSGANGRKPFNLIGVNKFETAYVDKMTRTSFLQFLWVDLEL